MKKNLSILCLLFVSSVLFSQNKVNELDSYLRNFQYQKALDFIDSQEEQSKDLLLQKVICLKVLGDYRRAIETLKPLDKEYPDDVQIKSELAICYDAIAQRQASISYYDDLIRLDSANTYFKMQKADILFKQNRYNKALEVFQNVYEQEKSGIASKRIGQCFERINQLDSANYYYRLAWDKNPNDAFAAASLINVCLKKGSITEATFHSEYYRSIDSTDTQINLLNAICFYETWDYEEASARFLRCYQNGDSSFIVKKNLGLSYYMLKDYYEAERFLDAAFKQDTTSNIVLFCLAETTNNLADHKKAIPLYEKLLNRVIPKDEDLCKYYDGLAGAYKKGNQLEKSIETQILASQYKKPEDKMSDYFTIAQTYENQLKNQKNALKYYKLYRISLDNYILSLTEIGAEVKQIKDAEKRLAALDTHIKALDKGNTDKKLVMPGSVLTERTEDGKMKVILNQQDTAMINRYKSLLEERKDAFILELTN